MFEDDEDVQTSSHAASGMAVTAKSKKERTVYEIVKRKWFIVKKVIKDKNEMGKTRSADHLSLSFPSGGFLDAFR
jgi:hypothetical protein